MGASGPVEGSLGDHVAFEEHEQRWRNVRGAAKLRSTPVGWAIGMVFDNLPDWNFAADGYNDDTGVLEIHDLDGLLADLGLAREEVTGHPLAFDDEGDLIVPWPVTQLVVRRTAQRYADRLLPIIEAEEAKARWENQWGVLTESGHHVTAERCREFDEPWAQARQTVRDWCGQSSNDRYDELEALCTEVVRLGLLVETAVGALRYAGAARAADRIERDLGVPIEVVRAQAKSTP
jgi:hypothetical protein